MLKILALSFVLCSFSAFAGGRYRAISENNPQYSFYQAVAQVEPSLVTSGAIDQVLDFNFKGIAGRIVGLKNGAAMNPLNLVFSVNGSLFFVPAGYFQIDSVLSFRRRWDDDPGIFVIVRGYRVGRGRAKVRTVAQVKLATTDGKVLPAVAFDDLEFPRP